MEATKITEADVTSLLRKEMEKGKSLSALARELGVDPGTISRILNGKRPVGKAVLRALGERYPELKADLALFLLG